MTVLFGLVALAILLWAAQKYLQADPRKLAAVLKLSGGIALLALAAFLGARGEMLIVLLGGGDKRTQAADIRAALSLVRTV